MLFNVDFPLFYGRGDKKLTVGNFIKYERVYIFGQVCKKQHYYASVNEKETKEGYPVQISCHLAQIMKDKEMIFFAEPHLAVNLVVVPDNYHREYYGDENLTWATDQNTRIVTFSDFLNKRLEGGGWKPNYYHRPPVYQDIPAYLNLTAWELSEEQDNRRPTIINNNTLYVIGTHDKGNRDNALGTFGVDSDNKKTFFGSTPSGWAMHFVLNYSDKINVLAQPHHAMEKIIIGDNQSKDMFYDFNLDNHNPEKIYFTEFMNKHALEGPLEQTKFESVDGMLTSYRHVGKCYLLPWLD
jgi:hypothetical protein